MADDFGTAGTRPCNEAEWEQMIERGFELDTKMASNKFEDFVKIFRVGTFNVNRFWLCDKADALKKQVSERLTEEEMGGLDFECWHWNNRVDRIAQTILGADVDILALNELRWMDTSSIQSLLSHKGIEERYRFVEWVANGTKLCMTNGLLYDRSKFFLLETGMNWLSETPHMPSDFDSNGFGRVAGGATFLPIDKNGKILWTSRRLQVHVVHLAPWPESLKWKQVEALKGFVNPDHHSIILGDFNFFDDCEGKEMRESMREKFSDLGRGALYSQSKEVAARTFVPYYYEKEYEKIKSTPSVLDHIFATSSVRVCDQEANAWLETKTYLPGGEPAELSDWDSMPSDHMLLHRLVEVDFRPEIHH